MSDAETPWETARDIAGRWADVTAGRVAQMVRHLGLGSSKHHTGISDGEATFSPAAVGLIERELRSRGYQARERGELSTDEARELVRRFLAEETLATDELEQMRAWVRARMDEGRARARRDRGHEEGAAMVDLRKALGWAMWERVGELHHLAQDAQAPRVVVFSCGPATAKCSCSCVDGGPCEHQWDGPTQAILDENTDTVTATCSRCGMAAIDHDMWVLP
jgi:hypothetical protein